MTLTKIQQANKEKHNQITKIFYSKFETVKFNYINYINK